MQNLSKPQFNKTNQLTRSNKITELPFADAKVWRKSPEKQLPPTESPCSITKNPKKPISNLFQRTIKPDHRRTETWKQEVCSLRNLLARRLARTSRADFPGFQLRLAVRLARVIGLDAWLPGCASPRCYPPFGFAIRPIPSPFRLSWFPSRAHSLFI